MSQQYRSQQAGTAGGFAAQQGAVSGTTSSGFVQQQGVATGAQTVEKEIVKDTIVTEVIREQPRVSQVPSLAFGAQGGETIRAEAVTAPTGVTAPQRIATGMTVSAGSRMACALTCAVADLHSSSVCHPTCRRPPRRAQRAS